MFSSLEGGFAYSGNRWRFLGLALTLYELYCYIQQLDLTLHQFVCIIQQLDEHPIILLFLGEPAPASSKFRLVTRNRGSFTVPKLGAQ